MGDRHSCVLQIDHPVPDGFSHVQSIVQETFLGTGEHSLPLEPGKMHTAQLVIGAGHEVVKRAEDVPHELPVLGVDGPCDIRQAQVVGLLGGVLTAIDCICEAMRRLTHHVYARKAAPGSELDGFFVAKVEHFHRGVLCGVAHQCGGLPFPLKD